MTLWRGWNSWSVPTILASRHSQPTHCRVAGPDYPPPITIGPSPLVHVYVAEKLELKGSFETTFENDLPLVSGLYLRRLQMGISVLGGKLVDAQAYIGAGRSSPDSSSKYFSLTPVLREEKGQSWPTWLDKFYVPKDGFNTMTTSPGQWRTTSTPSQFPPELFAQILSFEIVQWEDVFLVADSPKF
ncbi:hypothetical protein BV22DRAFT_1131757 [Leucogyrophana mollusca]|uniref:Uncharacterized protein n=1 Tax=Leucogyrophana mollusca TaxID=85980 RepID=A0ACB8B904_9AGAM|nr:hypothetical protein BV22DRAFT_1131757 [Leucogyrophana mollusca]